MVVDVAELSVPPTGRYWMFQLLTFGLASQLMAMLSWVIVPVVRPVGTSQGSGVSSGNVVKVISEP